LTGLCRLMTRPNGGEVKGKGKGKDKVPVHATKAHGEVEFWLN